MTRKQNSSYPSTDSPFDQVTRNMTRSKCTWADKPTYPTPSSRWPHAARDYSHAGSLTGQHRTQMIGPESPVAYTVATLRNASSRLYPRGVVVSQMLPGTRRASEKRDDAWSPGGGARHAGIRVIPPSSTLATMEALSPTQSATEHPRLGVKTCSPWPLAWVLKPGHNRVQPEYMISLVEHDLSTMASLRYG